MIAAFILSTTVAEAKTTGRTVEVVGQWMFGQTDDVNFDRWPDNWRRRQGRGYPAYLPVEIVPKDQGLMETAIRADNQLKPLRRLAKRWGGKNWSVSDVIVDQYLRIQLNGGAAVIQSPPVEITDAFSYRVTGAITTRRLKNNAAWIEYLFLDQNGDVLESEASKKLNGDHQWTHIEFPPTSPSPLAKSIVIRLHLEPVGQSHDIFGEAGFDNIRIQSMPKLRVATSRANGLYHITEQVTATCYVSGLSRPVTGLRFRLLDPKGEELARHRTKLDRSLQTATSAWELPPLPAGFYRIEADLYDRESITHSTKSTFGIINDLPKGPNPFGWTLASGHDPLPRSEVPGWLASCGVGWVKYPCWIDQQDRVGADELARLLEDLSDHGIRSVGLLDQFPDVPRGHRHNEVTAIAPRLRNANEWRPQLEALMTRLSMRTTWWQIGGDRDFSFLGQPNLADTIDGIRKELQGFGQPIRTAIAWPWHEPQPRGAKGGWGAICMSESPPFTASELEAQLKGLPTDSALNTWLMLDPLDRKKYSLEDRVRDLISRMIAVRRHEVPVTFVSNPFDARYAMLNHDGTPGEMLLPWRTTASVIGSLMDLGSIQLPRRSDNVLMAGDNRAVLILWNSLPTEEHIFLGTEAKQVDVWGHISKLPIDRDGRHVVRAEPLPKFIVDIDPKIAMFRIASKLDKSRLESLPGREQKLRLSIKNTFGSPRSGLFTVQTPKTWEVSRTPNHISLDTGEASSVPIAISLRSNAAIGRETMRFDFTIESEKPVRFSVWRDVEVGPEDIIVDPSIRFDEAGNLIIRINVTNLAANKQEFDLFMLSSSRQHQRKQSIVEPRQQAWRDFVWPNGRELIGQTLTLQAEDRNSRRLLVYPIKITP